jgi:prepilin-type N-terminal cleavage/methylation domain-containing protein
VRLTSPRSRLYGHAAAAPLRSSRRISTVGFTLPEVLVALVVLSLLFIGLVQGSRLYLLAWDQQTRLVARSDDLDAVDRVLRRLIVRARPGSEWEPLVFAGTAHSMTFTTIVPLPTAGSATRRADVELVVDGGHRLVLVWTPHLHAIRTGRPPPAVTTEILQGVERLELAYEPAMQGGWTPIWRDSVPPRLVRIRIVFADSTQSVWPDILVAPMLDPS